MKTLFEKHQELPSEQRTRFLYEVLRVELKVNILKFIDDLREHGYDMSADFLEEEI